jgi:hypothetical protein
MKAKFALHTLTSLSEEKVSILSGMYALLVLGGYPIFSYFQRKLHFSLYNKLNISVAIVPNKVIK